MAATNRKKLSATETKQLQTNYKFLIEELDANCLTPCLFQLGVISLDEMEAIQLQTQQYGKKGGIVHLMKILFRSGNNPYEGFIKSLTDGGYHHVVERLQVDVNNQSSETVDDSTRIDDLLSKYNTQKQTINKQQQDIISLTQSNNQLNGEVQSLKEEVRCIKHQLGAQKTEKPTNNEKEKRPNPWEKLSPEQQTRREEPLWRVRERPFRQLGWVRERPLTELERDIASLMECDGECDGFPEIVNQK